MFHFTNLLSAMTTQNYSTAMMFLILNYEFQVMSHDLPRLSGISSTDTQMISSMTDFMSSTERHLSRDNKHDSFTSISG